MDMDDFYELVAEMLGIKDDERGDDMQLEQRFYEEFDIDVEAAFLFASRLIEHTPQVKGGFGTKYHAFVSKYSPVMLMKKAVK